MRAESNLLFDNVNESILPLAIMFCCVESVYITGTEAVLLTTSEINERVKLSNTSLISAKTFESL